MNGVALVTPWLLVKMPERPSHCIDRLDILLALDFEDALLCEGAFPTGLGVAPSGESVVNSVVGTRKQCPLN